MLINEVFKKELQPRDEMLAKIKIKTVDNKSQLSPFKLT